MDTPSLNVHVACLRFRAKYECTGWEYEINARDISDGLDSKWTPYLLALLPRNEEVSIRAMRPGTRKNVQ
jgi:hypothetical protein